MPNYYYKDATGQEQGPLSIESLKALQLSPATPVREESQTEWKTAEQIEGLIEIPTVANVEEQVSTSTNISTATATPTATATNPKKSTAMLSWILSLLVLGGVGYFIYQDIEKNKGNTNAVDSLTMTTATTDTADVAPVTADMSTADTTSTNTAITDTANTTVTTPSTNDPTTVTPTTAVSTNDKQLLAKQKAEAEKKKQQLVAKQKAEDDKKKLIAAQALAAKQMQMRNNWSSYIKLGELNYQPKGDDGMTAFDVPVINGTDARINSVTVRIDYYKKEKKDKIVSSETITIYNLPAKSSLNGKGPENKKARKAVATITAINSTQLHFCYPKGSGTSGDPYFCN